jgi:hypothetical protein
LLEVFHSLHEGALPNDHYNVDGVKIFFAIKTSGQVGVSIRGRVEVVTQRASKAKPFGSMARFQVEHGNDNLFNGDLVTHHFQKIRRITLGHRTAQKISVAAMRT